MVLNLKLYVTGSTPGLQRQVAALRGILDEALGGAYELQVLDIFTHPDAAYDDAVVVTPTLVRRLPPPAAQIIGDLSDRERVLVGLNLEEPGA